MQRRLVRPSLENVNLNQVAGLMVALLNELPGLDLNWRQEPPTIDWASIDFSKAKARRLRRNTGWSLRLYTLMALPVLVAIGYFAYVYTIGKTHNAEVVTDGFADYKLQARTVSGRACRRVLSLEVL